MRQKEYSKEGIRNRMFARASELWDVRSIENLDPLVRAMIEGLASEVFRLSGEIEGSEERIFEKLARAFTPANMIAISPAHALCHGRAVSGTCIVNRDAELFHRDTDFMKRYNLTQLPFSPVCSPMIVDGDVSYLIACSRFHHVSLHMGKEYTAGSLRRDPLFNNTVWVALDLSSEVRDLKNLSFCLDFPMFEEREIYLRLLGHTKWSVGGKNLAIRQGIYNADEERQRRSLGGGQESQDQIDRQIRERYRNHFVTVEENFPVTDSVKTLFPEELKAFFSDDFIAMRKTPMLWLKVKFPPAFNDEILDMMTVQINCFPIANKFRVLRLSEITPTSNVISLSKKVNEYLLAVDSVRDSDNKPYVQVHEHQHMEEEIGGTYSLRRGSCERFNDIDAQEALMHLMDLFRDESAAFMGMDKDLLGQSTHDLIAQITRFNNNLNQLDNRGEQLSYIIFGQSSMETTITVQYYLTNGVIGNGIRAGKVLSVNDFSDIVPASAMLMTTCRGGKPSPDMNRQKEIYRFMLTSHGTVYTIPDIIAFCNSKYREYFDRVEVRNGYEISRTPREGVIRTTEVMLHGLRLTDRITPDELRGDILADLEMRSPEGLNYRIVMNYDGKR